MTIKSLAKIALVISLFVGTVINAGPVYLRKVANQRQGSSDCGYHSIYDGMKEYRRLEGKTVGAFDLNAWRNLVNQEFGRGHGQGLYNDEAPFLAEHPQGANLPRGSYSVILDVSEAIANPYQLDQNTQRALVALRTQPGAKHIFIAANDGTRHITGAQGHWIAVVAHNEGGRIVYYRMCTGNYSWDTDGRIITDCPTANEIVELVEGIPAPAINVEDFRNRKITIEFERRAGNTTHYKTQYIWTDHPCPPFPVPAGYQFVSSNIEYLDGGRPRQQPRRERVRQPRQEPVRVIHRPAEPIEQPIEQPVEQPRRRVRVAVQVPVQPQPKPCPQPTTVVVQQPVQQHVMRRQPRRMVRQRQEARPRRQARRRQPQGRHRNLRKRIVKKAAFKKIHMRLRKRRR